MVTIDSGVSFHFPDTWKRFMDGKRCVFHTPRREEIILSANRLAGNGLAAERAQLLERMFGIGLEAVTSAASAHDLKITNPLAEEPNAYAFRCATVLA